MVVTTFESIFEKARREGVSQKVREAQDWYRKEAGKTRIGAISLIKEDVARLQPTINTRSIGRMFLFHYDAKHKNDRVKLPYWDRYPLIFPVDLHEEGFYGINFHYLPPLQRARLLDALESIRNNNKYNDTTKLNINYRLLKASSKLRLFKPCFKMYLTEHVRSKYMYVAPNEWPFSIFLPLAKWEGATTGRIYKESMEKARV